MTSAHFENWRPGGKLPIGDAPRDTPETHQCHNAQDDTKKFFMMPVEYIWKAISTMIECPDNR